MVERNKACVVVLLETITSSVISSKLLKKVKFEKIDLASSKSFLCTAVYANPNEVIRHAMWEEIMQISSSVNEPWIVGGDFNDISEKKGGSRPDLANCSRFQQFLDACRIEDIGGLGSKFTWQVPKWHNLDRVYKKLDRVCANVLWRMSFEDADVRILPRILSDHNPLVLSILKPVKQWVTRPFRFLATWLNHPCFGSFMDVNWNANLPVNSMLLNLIFPLKI
ncbi:uncharacterized protein LOC133304934 [Gastrolobium bilobum]|uniref:uncharacterized protein LOC133304934 n=1 Tax=Gastrolobium bilobum TaxID=150636 RepID=UPI002AAF231E|nr:uncharacterized protein LOC133304934 [Gastrolobium bilobum]